MSRYYGWRGILVHPDDLIAFAWSAPMRDLAKKIGISDVGLRKLLTSHGVTLPPQGHWNRVHAGRIVPAPPNAFARRPGETGRIWIDERFAPFLEKAKPMPSGGPFATPEVPEDLEELRAKELKAISSAKVPKTLELVHPALKPILAKESNRRQKTVEHSWHWDTPKFDGALDQRKLRLLNGIFLALAKRGHGGDVHETDDEIHVRLKIGDTQIGVTIDIVGKHRTVSGRRQTRPAPDLPATTPLSLRIKPGFDNEIGETWQDDVDGKLESKIASIAAGLIVAGEAKFRRQLREDEKQAEQDRLNREAKAERERLERERRMIETLQKMNEQRLADLQKSGELLRLSRDIRTLVVEVRGAIAGQSGVDVEELEAWESWALKEADKLDPVLSGQFLSHLRPPTLDSTEG